MFGAYNFAAQGILEYLRYLSHVFQIRQSMYLRQVLLSRIAAFDIVDLLHLRITY